MAWKIGQQVVCVIPSPMWGKRDPVMDGIYTILDLRSWPKKDNNFNEPCLILAEFQEIRYFSWYDKLGDVPYYFRYRFRPLVNISVFDKILAEVNDKEKIHA